MTRIQMATDSVGTGAYTFAYNPAAIECDDSQNSLQTKCVGSETVKYLLPFDSRPITFIWKEWNFDHVIFSGMVNTLYSGLNQIKYFKLNSIQPMFKNIFTSTGYNGGYRIEQIIPSVSSDGGKSWTDLKMVIHKV
jgi:hypothetical protein